MPKAVNLKKALELFGATNIEFRKKTYNYRSGFFDKDGQLYNFNTNDLRDSNIAVMIRTAAHRKDFTGGTNTYPLESFLAERDLTLVIPRTKQDHNPN